MASVAWSSSGATTYNLTSVSTNSGAAPLATAREGGFTMRNRIVWANVTAPTLTNKVMNILQLLRIPARTVVEDLYLVAPAGSGATTHAIGASYVASASVSSGVGEFGFIAYQSASWSSSQAVAGGFAQVTASKSKLHTSSVLALPTDPETSPKGSVRAIRTDVAGAAQGFADGGDDASGGMHFPYGGYVTFQFTGGKGSVTAAASWDGRFAGTTEVIARGWKVPE